MLNIYDIHDFDIESIMFIQLFFITFSDEFGHPPHTHTHTKHEFSDIGSDLFICQLLLLLLLLSIIQNNRKKIPNDNHHHKINNYKLEIKAKIKEKMFRYEPFITHTHTHTTTITDNDNDNQNACKNIEFKPENIFIFFFLYMWSFSTGRSLATTVCVCVYDLHNNVKKE